MDGTITNSVVSESDRSASDAPELFQAALPAEFFGRQRVAPGLPPERGIYTAAVVVMLVILQRLQGKATLSGAVRQILNGRLRELVPGRKRVRERTLSGNAGACSRARSRLPQAVVEMSADGSSVTLPHTAELLKYPPGRGGKGESRWPVLRVLVADYLVSGIALRPAFGPIYGDHAVSGQALAKEVIGRLPAGSVGVRDRNFGVFSVVRHADQTQHTVVVRMTDARARSLSGGKLPSQADHFTADHFTADHFTGLSMDRRKPGA